jgi:hypothetical protein
MSISDEENKEFDNHQEDMDELGATEEQNEAGSSSARILEPISRSPEDEQMEDYVEKTDDEGVDESAETEPIYGESNYDFGFMLEQVQMIIENLLSKKADSEGERTKEDFRRAANESVEDGDIHFEEEA